MNVNVENLNMNVSLQHRTVLGLVEDRKSRSSCLFRFHYSHVLTFSFSLTDKELIDQHQKEIDELKNKAPMAMPEIKGDFDMGEMMKIFAAKTPPDNTIKRIENLEGMMTDLNDRLKNVNPTKPVEQPDMLFDTSDLLNRVQSLENRANQSDRRFDKDEEVLADHERRIKALEAMDMSASAPTGEVDTASIMKQVNMLRAETSSMRQDFNDFKSKVSDEMAALRRELMNYCDK